MNDSDGNNLGEVCQSRNNDNVIDDGATEVARLNIARVTWEDGEQDNRVMIALPVIAGQPHRLSITYLESNMLGKLILGLSAFIFIAYGLLCLANPALPAGFAGLAIVNGDGYAEIGAMYGGLQTGIGLFCLLAIMRPMHVPAALTLLVVAIGGLALARLGSMVTSEMAVTLYSWGALFYETLTALLAAIALRRSPSR